ncbi:ImmA/IrrE family metallo-endopeptidase [Bacillus inaquosorum]|uniref:ImmA/IrrE family metallo-endopeptidase n=1 Tax=Bacillus vallismortis TaxID=72361 RepID=UPI00227E7483|nr:ImmA/IrrE family metallo-endopeptidase [Bacillus vallismortis]MCY8546877.1 ImmA/IrrE family metallo-endopeptidase [Bacillus vallismortis]MEC0680674.1 ImmA/IrrE family metallo-endopeptidase [Bacillus inaquosorum]
MVKAAVQKLIKKYKTSNPYELASYLNINVFQWDLHHEIMGFYKYDKRNKYIVINSNLSQGEKTFVCSHELGHAQLHPRANTPFMKEHTLFSVDKVEVEANTFAVELLLPDWVISQYKTTNFTLKDVAVMNGVPAELAHLKDLSEVKNF